MADGWVSPRRRSGWRALGSLPALGLSSGDVCTRHARVSNPRAPRTGRRMRPRAPILKALSPQSPWVPQACPPAEPNPVPHRPQKAFLHRAPPVTYIRPLDRELDPNTARAPAIPREASSQLLSPADCLRTRRLGRSPPKGLPKPRLRSQACSQTSLRQRPSSSDCSPGRTPPAALPSCSLQSRHSFSSTPSSHTRAHGACGPAGLAQFPGLAAWSRKDV